MTSTTNPASMAHYAALQAQLKNEGTALLLAVFLFGGSRFYLGQVGSGLLHLFTFGLLGIGWIYDMATARKRCRVHNQRIMEQMGRLAS